VGHQRPAVRESGVGHHERSAADGGHGGRSAGKRVGEDLREGGRRGAGQDLPDAALDLRVERDRARRSGHDDHIGTLGIRYCGRVEADRGEPARHPARPFDRDELHCRSSGGERARREEHFVRRDHVEWIEPIEQSDLDVHWRSSW
jgi:hypothetical protein